MQEVDRSAGVRVINSQAILASRLPPGSGHRLPTEEWEVGLKAASQADNGKPILFSSAGGRGSTKEKGNKHSVTWKVDLQSPYLNIEGNFN